MANSNESSRRSIPEEIVIHEYIHSDGTIPQGISIYWMSDGEAFAVMSGIEELMTPADYLALQASEVSGDWNTIRALREAFATKVRKSNEDGRSLQGIKVTTLNSESTFNTKVGLSRPRKPLLLFAHEEHGIIKCHQASIDSDGPERVREDQRIRGLIRSYHGTSGTTDIQAFLRVFPTADGDLAWSPPISFN